MTTGSTEPGLRQAFLIYIIRKAQALRFFAFVEKAERTVRLLASIRLKYEIIEIFAYYII